MSLTELKLSFYIWFITKYYNKEISVSEKEWKEHEKSKILNTTAS